MPRSAMPAGRSAGSSSGSDSVAAVESFRDFIRLATVVTARVPTMISRENQIGISPPQGAQSAQWYSWRACSTSFTPMKARMTDRPRER